ncbi:hypothetical protein [Lactococcus lactis]|uniref:hypothetical protein n=1 Tax=Lactococcus lactis TaxID=1358 RepID=UPI0032E38640
MKLDEIEGVKEVNTWIGGLPYTVEPVDKLHTPEQMQEYAKECVRAALKEYVGPYSDKKANSIISRIVK